MKNKSRDVKIIIGILILFAVVLYASYSIFNSLSKTDTNTISTGNILMSFTEGNSVHFDGGTALSDDEGKAIEDYFQFAISASAENKLKLAYYIYAIPDSANTINANTVKIYLSKYANGTETALINPTLFSSFTRFNTATMVADNSANNYLIYSDTFDFASAGTQTNYFHLRMWLDDTGSSGTPNVTHTDKTDGASHSVQIGSTGTFKFKINAYSEQGDVKL